MRRTNATAVFRLSAVLFLVVGSVGCRSESDAAEVDPRPPCAAACAAIVEAGCERAGLRREDHASCVASCMSKQPLATRAGCEAARFAYLGCVARSRIDCEAASCSAGVCIEQGAGILGCDRPRSEYRECIGACEGAGSIHVGQAQLEVGGAKRQVVAEVVRSGCRDCTGQARRGAPPGSACQLHSVCEQSCCRCAGSRARYLARACVAGACASAEEICSLARRAAPRDPCLP